MSRAAGSAVLPHDKAGRLDRLVLPKHTQDLKCE